MYSSTARTSSAGLIRYSVFAAPEPLPSLTRSVDADLTVVPAARREPAGNVTAVVVGAVASTLSLTLLKLVGIAGAVDRAVLEVEVALGAQANGAGVGLRRAAVDPVLRALDAGVVGRRRRS